MSWYRSGTVTVTNGSTAVTGAGTDFVANAQIGHAFLGPDGRVYEIGQVVAATQITLTAPYMGGSGGGQGYAIMPTSSFARDLALLAAELLNGFASVRDGVGQGLFPDGTGGALGISFSADRDTGFRRPAPDLLAIVTGGGDRVLVDIIGILVNGRLAATAPDTAFHRLVKPDEAVGAKVVGFGFTTEGDSAHFSAQRGAAASSAATNLWLNASLSTGRSLNAGGTLNASGADYAEYMTKTAVCGPIAKGDVCGVDVDGHLTRTWADSISFVVKSTDPAYVGGDVWGRSVGPRPDGPGDAATASQMAAHDTALAAWEADLEAERQKVDRIAFAGQVPVNVSGDFAVGDYIVAAASGAGIKAVAVPAADITFDQYRRRLGKVWAVRDGRAWVDVQHG